MRTHRPPLLSASLFASLGLPLAGLAQCPNTWQALPGCPGADLPVGAFANYDPDGPGPLPMQVVLAGAFQQVGTVATEGLALWNPTTGTFADVPDPSLPFPGALLRGPLAVRGTDLYVATFAPATLRSRINRFDGASWTSLGGDFDGAVHTLCIRANGDLVVGGNFNLGGSTALPGIASWDGTAWNAVPGLSGAIFAIDELANGDLLVGGQTNLGGVARLAGTTWSAVGSNAPFQAVAVAGLPSGDVVIADGASVHRFDGTQWNQVPQSPAAGQHQPMRLLRTSSGALVVGGFWVGLGSGATQATHAVQLDVATGQWTPLGLADNSSWFESVNALIEAPNGDLLVGGGLIRAGGLDLANLARFDGSSWHALADGPTNFCLTAVALGGDQFVVGGGFRSFGNLPLRSVAQWTGSAWAPLGTGLDGVVHDLVRLPDGSLIAGGEFQTAGGVQTRALARWDGVAWSEFGGAAGPGPFTSLGAVYRLLPLANGDLLIGGDFQSIGGVPCNSLARWNGTSFQPVPGTVPLQGIRHLGELPNGDLLVAGTSGVYQQWFGSWVWFGNTGPGTGVSTTDYLASLRVLRNGAVAIGAFTTSSNHVLHLFDPSGSWQPLAMDGEPSELYELPDGDLLVTGFFTSIGGVAADGAARIGSFLPAVVSPAEFDGHGVFTLAPLANGDLLALGTMTSLGGAPAYGVAALQPGCRPFAAGYGSGCTGSAGPNVLEATSLPWLGSTFSMRATGLPTGSLALAMVGLQPQATPLPLVTPLGTTGCELLTSIDLESLQPTGNGVLDLELRIPDAPFLIGFVLHAQVAPLDVDASGFPVGVTSTNALQLVIGDR